MILVTWDACVFTAADIDKIVAFQFDFDPVLPSPNPLLMYSASVKDSENADLWLAALSSSIVH